MHKLIDLPNLNISINNLKLFDKNTKSPTNYQRIKYLKINKKTSSPYLNAHFNRLASNFLDSVAAPDVSTAEFSRISQLSFLKSACSSDADLLSYKGINLGSAINMKLAVKLGSLLGKQQG